MLVELCDQNFLRLWNYPNPYKEDGHELCDLIVVFDNHVFVFFDREGRKSQHEERDGPNGRKVSALNLNKQISGLDSSIRPR